MVAMDPKMKVTKRTESMPFAYLQFILFFSFFLSPPGFITPNSFEPG